MSIKDSLDSLRSIDINDLDLNNVGSWPGAVKFIAGLLLLIIVLALGYNFHLKDAAKHARAASARRGDAEGAVLQQSLSGGES
jgi:Tfp pilus assembly protein PilO